MKRLCHGCKKKHNRQKLDVMNARMIPNAFCSDFCHNLDLFNRGIVKADTVKIPIEEGHKVKVDDLVNCGGTNYPVSEIGDNWIRISNETNH